MAENSEIAITCSARGREIELDGNRSVFLGKSDSYPGDHVVCFRNGENKEILRLSNEALEALMELRFEQFKNQESATE